MQHVSINPDVEQLNRNRENQRIRELKRENMSLRQQVGALIRKKKSRPGKSLKIIAAFLMS